MVGVGEGAGGSAVIGRHEAVDVLVTDTDTIFVTALGVTVVVMVVMGNAVCGIRKVKHEHTVARALEVSDDVVAKAIAGVSTSRVSIPVRVRTSPPVTVTVRVTNWVEETVSVEVASVLTIIGSCVIITIEPRSKGGPSK